MLRDGLMTHKTSLIEYKEKIYINDDITLLRTRLAKAVRLRADIKSVTMLNKKVVIYETGNSNV